MYQTSFKEKITKLNTHLLVALFFVIPFSTAVGTILSCLILIGWLLIADFKENWHAIKSNKLVLACLLFLGLHLVGLLWTADIQWGLHVLKKEWKIFMIPVFMLYAREEYIKRYICTFIIAMAISELISFSIWLEIIPPFKHASISNPLPFMTHITYNPLLTLSIYLSADSLIFNKNLSNKLKIFYSICLITMTINMFITGGRSGQIMFFAAIFVLIVQYYQGKIFQATIIYVLIASSIFTIAYSTSDLFKERCDMAIEVVTDYGSNNKYKATGQRITFALNSFEIIAEHPIFGVGTGDLPVEYAKINKKNTPELPDIINPHNMYIMEMIQFGIFGLISLLWIFYVQIRLALLNRNKQLRRIGIALPVLFFILNFGESYLSVFSTSLFFAIFSSFLYKD